MKPDGSDVEKISGDFDRGLRRGTQLMWAPDGSGVYFNVGQAGTRNLHFASTNGGVRQVTSGNHMLTLSSFTEGGQAVGLLEDSQNPVDVIAFDLNDPENLHQLTNVNDDVLAGVNLGEVEEVWYKSVDYIPIVY